MFKLWSNWCACSSIFWIQFKKLTINARQKYHPSIDRLVLNCHHCVWKFSLYLIKVCFYSRLRLYPWMTCEYHTRITASWKSKNCYLYAFLLIKTYIKWHSTWFSKRYFHLYILFSNDAMVYYLAWKIFIENNISDTSLKSLLFLSYKSHMCLCRWYFVVGLFLSCLIFVNCLLSIFG